MCKAVVNKSMKASEVCKGSSVVMHSALAQYNEHYCSLAYSNAIASKLETNHKFYGHFTIAKRRQQHIIRPNREPQKMQILNQFDAIRLYSARCVIQHGISLLVMTTHLP